ncbi:MAG TPA: DUF4105 domain-containing protein [Lysobacter sp.]|nr:DUF4105 domain-containing protein [Lysobacter sp.]
MLTLLLLLTPLFAAAAPRVGVMTMQPGEVFWERFGHDAIVVDDPSRGEPVSYNFGFFDPTESGFVGNFVAGRMRYALVALPLREDLATYRDEGRGVRLQWLDLAPAQARSIADALERNARPENSRYRYDYFRDNCATRVRDAIDRGIGGLLHERLAASSRGLTYRSESTRLASPAHWMWLGFELGLGPNADVPLSRWDESFVPMRLADNLREVRFADGRPLVAAEEQLLPHRIAPEPGDPSSAWWPYALAGLAIAALILVAAKCRPRLLAAFAFPFWLLCGLVGALLLYLWLGTGHWAAWANHNLLLLDPLCLLLLPGAWGLVRGRRPGRLFAWTLLTVALLGLGALAFAWLQVRTQQNMRWIVLLLPIHLALLGALRRR